MLAYNNIIMVYNGWFYIRALMILGMHQDKHMQPIHDFTYFMDLIGVEFAFTEPDYRANEPDLMDPTTFQPVFVFKSTQIASRVELVVVPLTVDEARATSLPLPPNIPFNDPRSPPFASKRNVGCVINYYVEDIDV